jgi:hypothetical protein
MSDEHELGRAMGGRRMLIENDRVPANRVRYART